MWDIIEATAKGAFRLFIRALVDILYNLLFLGPGYLWVSRFGSRKDIDPHSWEVLFASVLFWGTMGFLIYKLGF